MLAAGGQAHRRWSVRTEPVESGRHPMGIEQLFRLFHAIGDLSIGVLAVRRIETLDRTVEPFLG